MLVGNTRGDGDKVWEIGKNILKQIQPRFFWILPSWMWCPVDPLGFTFTLTLSRRSHMAKIKSILKCLKKDGVSHPASYLGATPLFHLTTPQEQCPVALISTWEDTSELFLTPVPLGLCLVECFWRNQRLRDDPHRAVVFLCRLSSQNGLEISNLWVF